MRYRVRIIATGAALGLAAMTAGLAPAAQGARPVQEHRAAAPVVTAKMTPTKLTFSDSTVRAGRITFKATSAKGDRVLQLLKLHSGYTLQQAGADFQLAFGKTPDVAAIARLDDNVTWLGGADATPGKPGWYQVTLKSGNYYGIDQNGSGLAPFVVKGSPQKRSAQATHGTITTFSYGFRSDGTLPAKGWITATNRADQPHFIVLQQVKNGTTRKQVEKFFKHGGNGQPPWGLKASSGLGVISPGTSVAWQLDLPKGEYVMMCFWPDRFTGMPHVAMGMFDLTHLS